MWQRNGRPRKIFLGKTYLSLRHNDYGVAGKKVKQRAGLQAPPLESPSAAAAAHAQGTA
jgi:hypothetical protein